MATPSDTAKLRAESREAIRDVQESWGDMTPPVYEPPVIENHVHIDRPSSDPPSSRRTNGRLLGIAAIITALGGAAGVQQCAGQARTVPAIKQNGPKL